MLTTKMTMAEAFRQVATQYPDREELVCGEVRLTYRQILDRVEALANGLQGLGIGKGDKIACLLPPGVEFVYLFFAVAEMGAIIVPLNPQLREWNLERILAEVEPCALVTAHPAGSELLREIPSLHHIIFIDDSGKTGLSFCPRGNLPPSRGFLLVPYRLTG